ncbi:hypothetical protein TorRG33x02_028120 [Trema orientale]|uniref:Uncharacterized protein n=1 Tax=Trema orientale TaxID=63057 RepID=A0A2P5FUQ9_TREOI|nr:hypothetical protein TorRG33x02_028120 [Trema orientale]
MPPLQALLQYSLHLVLPDSLRQTKLRESSLRSFDSDLICGEIQDESLNTDRRSFWLLVYKSPCPISEFRLILRHIIILCWILCAWNGEPFRPLKGKL